jgi:hypothetical protein
MSPKRKPAVRSQSEPRVSETAPTTDPERAEFLVRVEWEWTVPAGQGIWAKRFFSRRVTVAELRDPVTSRKLCAHVGIPFTENEPDQSSQTS